MIKNLDHDLNQVNHYLDHDLGQTDDDLDNLDPNQQLWDVVQDLYGTDPAQETCAINRWCRSYGSHPATWARSYRSYRSYTSYTDQIDHDLYHLQILPCRYEMLCRICTVHIQPRKHVLDHADYTVPTRQHELDHTDHTDHTDQEFICLPWKI